MRYCPLCGKPSINASTRLIKDTCGHTKCRLCLLQEESGCTVCSTQNLEQTAPSITPIGNFDYVQPIASIPILENIPVFSVELPMNEFPQTVEYLDNPFNTENVIINEHNESKLEGTEVPNKNQYYEEKRWQVNNEVGLNDHLLLESIENSSFNTNIKSKFHNSLSIVKHPIINNTNNENIFQKNKKTQDEQIDENSEQQTIEFLESLITNNANKEVPFNQSNITFVLLLDDNSPKRIDSENTVQITEINENENKNKDNNLPHKTPDQLVMYKSPEFRMSDYLVFNKQGENINLNQFIVSPAQSVGSWSPDFRLTDHLLFKKQGGKVYPQLIASPAQSFGSLSPEFRLSDYILFHKSGDSLNGSQLVLSPAHSTGYRSPEFRLSDYLIFGNQSEKTVYARLITSPIESFDARVSGSPVQQIGRNKNNTDNSQDNDDEDKENKGDSIIKNEIKCNEKDVESTGVNSGDTRKKHKKRNLQTKSKKIKNSDTSPKLRKCGRKPKLKIVTDEVGNEKERKKPVVERRKMNKDWSHIVKLPGYPTSYQCTKCKRSFRNFLSKSYHAACILGESPFCCEICGKTFKKRSHFNYHEMIHTGNKPFKCETCQKSFATKNKLDRHMLSHKPQPEFECDDCGKKLSTKDNLKSHLALHRNFLFKCKHCPKTYTIKLNLRRHEQYCLSNNKRFTCEVCAKVFEKDYLLGQHKMRLHRKGKTHCCDVCKRVFLTKSEFTRHVSIHSDVKAYYCNICDIQFGRKDNWKRHEKNHHVDPHTEINENVTTISAKECIVETSPKQKGQKRQATNSPEPSSKPKKTPNKTKKVTSPSKLNSPSSDISNALPVIKSSNNIKYFPKNNVVTKNLTEPLSLQTVLQLHQQIEQKLHAQNSYCSFPGLTCEINSPGSSSSRVRDNCSSNSNSNDGVSKASDESEDQFTVKEREVIGMQHWRRRTAESLKLKYKS